MLRELHRRLRPMGFADILDEAIELYKRNFVLLVGIAAFLYVPVAFLQLAIRNPAYGPGPIEARDMGSYLSGLYLVLLIYWIATVFVTGALTFATSEIYLGRKTSVLACYRRVAKPSVFFRFLLTNILWVLAIAGSVIVPFIVFGIAAAVFGTGQPISTPAIVLGVLFLLAGVCACALPAYVASRLAVYTPAFFVEGCGASSALRRSWGLLKGRVVSTFGIMLTVVLGIFLVKMIVLSPFTVTTVKNSLAHVSPSTAFSAGYTIVDAALDVLMTPITSMVIILLYYDARIRKEGFDLEVLAAELDQRTQPMGGYGSAPLPQEAAPQNPPEPGEQG